VGPRNGLFVLHKCDVRSCVNPHHLYLGTHAQNGRDKMNRGRCAYMKGSANPRAKLTEGTAREILGSAEPATAIAGRLGVSVATVYRVRRRHGWMHI
jgi:DNA invertase Pin-like site-specific DNA recombinase